ncbi:MAG: leucyl aminopeptidase family protein [Rhodospirillales bacterium]|nr:leucyl aminopeptidase family protein [Rhodospirillales bacterium]
MDAADGRAIPIEPIGAGTLSDRLERLGEAQRRWVRATGFAAEPGHFCLVPEPDGSVATVLLGVNGGDEADEKSSGTGNGTASSEMWDWAVLPTALPPGPYCASPGLAPARAAAAATGWALGAYRYDRYRKSERELARLVWPEACDRSAVARTADAIAMVRDLINAPAADMGPGELAGVALDLAARYGALSSLIVGDDLLAANYPGIHAVGRASIRPPRLIDLVWGEADRPRVTLVGKGVCFDTGGLDLKPSAAMKLMKKDMGGAAMVLGLARMIMDAHLPVRLRVLIPAVENSVSGNAMRPLDVITTRMGTTIEIGNTDAEGRVILADALCEAASEAPDLLIDCATLTGAARVALGPELPAVFSTDDALADMLLAQGRAHDDPLWRLPLWRPYRRLIDGKTADLTNAPDSPFAGAITAALFLSEFVTPVTAWIHIDTMAWNTAARPGRPEGGEASGLRALYALIGEKYRP